MLLIWTHSILRLVRLPRRTEDQRVTVQGTGQSGWLGIIDVMGFPALFRDSPLRKLY